MSGVGVAQDTLERMRLRARVAPKRLPLRVSCSAEAFVLARPRHTRRASDVARVMERMRLLGSLIYRAQDYFPWIDDMYRLRIANTALVMYWSRR